jgi:chemotaxis family two-component system sensor kinase Cph1
MKNTQYAREAELFLQKSVHDIQSMSAECVQKLIQNLQIHQIELSIQNEELRRVQQELNESRNRYFDLYNFAPAGYLTIDSDGIIANANLTATMLLDMKRSDIIGKKINDLIVSEDRDVYHLHTQELIEHKTKNACIVQILKGTGDTFYARIESDFVQDEHGNQSRSLVFIDVSTCKALQTDLQKTVEALTKSNTELERFAYVASHDLREPLRNISACTQMLDTKYYDVLGEEGRQLVGYTNASVEQMNSLISDLLAYSRQSENAAPFEVVDCNVALGYVVDNLQRLIVENKAVITSDKLPEIKADGTQMVQLLQNIISNAIKHNNGNDIKIHVAVQKQEDQWLFSVADNGPGIESEYLDKVFEIFTRLETKNRYMGTGIGLAVCKKAVVNHGGRIWAESDFGKGATFYFTLPANI